MATDHKESIVALILSLIALLLFLALEGYFTPQSGAGPALGGSPSPTSTFRGPTGAPFIKGPTGPPPNY